MATKKVKIVFSILQILVQPPAALLLRCEVKEVTVDHLAGSPTPLVSPVAGHESGGYPDNLRCVWILRAREPGAQVLVTFRYVKLANIRDQCGDSIYVTDGDSLGYPTLVQFCQTVQDSSHLPTLASTNGTMLVFFKTDSESSGRGFYADINSIIPITECSSTGTVLTDDSGQIASPNYPYDYPPQASCRWIIQAYEDYIVSVTFVQVQLSFSFTCADSLTIHDGPDRNTPIIQKLCEATPITHINSTQRFMYIHFVSDSEAQQTGFLLNYTLAPGDGWQPPSNTSIEGVTQTPMPGLVPTTPIPNEAKCGALHISAEYEWIEMGGGLAIIPYPSREYTYCRWFIDAPKGKQVLLTLKSISLPPCSSSKDTIKVYEAPYQTDEYLLKTFCGEVPINDELRRGLISRDSQMVVIFESLPPHPFTGYPLEFLMQVYFQSARECSAVPTEITSEGKLFSPNYNLPYPNYVLCNWWIRAPDHMLVKLGINPFEVAPQQSGKCEEAKDDVLIYDGRYPNSSELLPGQPLCGKLNQLVLVSTTPHVYITFMSDETRPSKEYIGFEIVVAFTEPTTPSTESTDVTSTGSTNVMADTTTDAMADTTTMLVDIEPSDMSEPSVIAVIILSIALGIVSVFLIGIFILKAYRSRRLPRRFEINYTEPIYETIPCYASFRTDIQINHGNNNSNDQDSGTSTMINSSASIPITGSKMPLNELILAVSSSFSDDSTTYPTTTDVPPPLPPKIRCQSFAEMETNPAGRGGSCSDSGDRAIPHLPTRSASSSSVFTISVADNTRSSGVRQSSSIDVHVPVVLPGQPRTRTVHTTQNNVHVQSGGRHSSVASSSADSNGSVSSAQTGATAANKPVANHDYFVLEKPADADPHQPADSSLA